MNAIEKLQTERQNLVDRLAKIDKILREYDELQRVAESYLATNLAHTLPPDSRPNSVSVRQPQAIDSNFGVSTMPGVRKPKTPMADFERAVIEVLSEAEEPLDRSALYKTLIEHDVVIGSPDESADLNTLSARMSRMKEKVVNVNRYGYWLKGRAFLPGGYDPKGGIEARSFDD